jgi:iron complex outermembrane receptor protein
VALPAAAASLIAESGLATSFLGRPGAPRRFSPATSVVYGRLARPRIPTDGGSVLLKSPAAVGVGVQRRTPIVNDPRIRGSRIGQLAASGSYWVPAREDLDTMLSKIDARAIDTITTIRGPYSALYGPGFNFIDVQLLAAPRYADGDTIEGMTSADYQTNGEQFYGRQVLTGGNERQGYRVGYGHRTGNDYKSGNGTDIPSSYKSRDLELAYGLDLTEDQHVNVSYLRLDQTDVEFPGYAFDLNYLVTDAVDIDYALEDQAAFDRFDAEFWYNRTHFNGNAQRTGKRQQFPLFNFFHLTAFTDVDSTSTGYRFASTWGDEETGQLTAGTDFRYLRQELNELSTGRIGLTIFEDANSPIPKSESPNPGLFTEAQRPLTERWTVTAGARADYVAPKMLEDVANLQALGLAQPQSSLAEILGTDDFDQEFGLWAAYLSGAYEIDPHWTATIAGGHAEQAPTMTEMYAAQTFLFVLQNGQNTVTGDPRLDNQRLWQIDLALQCEYDRFRAGLNGFQAWIHDYITFENMGIFRGPPQGQVEQVSLKYVNTDLATLTGAELFMEYDLTSRWTPFATLSYVEGRDHTRNGDFATREASSGQASERVYGLDRGAFSGIAGGAEEPLPSIVPLESRLGLRFHQASDQPRWELEFQARVVAAQDRVATSLLESPTAGFTTYDLRGRWRATDQLLLLAGVENLADKQYREHLDFRSPSGISVFQPGISFYSGVELNY